MNPQFYLEILFDDLSIPFALIDLSSFEIFSINLPMALILNDLMASCNDEPSKLSSNDFIFMDFARINSFNHCDWAVFVAFDNPLNNRFVDVNNLSCFYSAEHSRLIDNATKILSQYIHFSLSPCNLTKNINPKFNCSLFCNCHISNFSSNFNSFFKFFK